jgi:hypothetical protein
LIEIWETFLLQLDAEDEVPGQTVQASEPGQSQTIANEATEQSTSGGEGQLATATDVALEQDAGVVAGRDPDA